MQAKKNSMDLTKDSQVICNACGRVMRKTNGIYQEDFVTIVKSWGYFSRKDGVVQTVVMCEECFEKLCENLVVLPQTRENHELLGV